MIVSDTNLLAYLLLPGERTASAERVLRTDSAWAAPFLWRSELRSVLGHWIRRGGLTVSTAVGVFAYAEEIVRGREYLVESGAVLDLLNASDCSAYDCEFVALARELGIPLVTSDRKILRAFPETAVSMEEFSK